MRRFLQALSPSMCSVAATLLLFAAPLVANAQVAHEVLHSFDGLDGFGPMAGVVEGPDGALYGTASQGGAANLGTTFRFDRVASALTKTDEFNGVDGATLYSGLSVGLDGLLYGSTFAGGTHDLGTLFLMHPDGTGFATLHSFDGTDGAKPDDLKLVPALGEYGPCFYGATSEGGPDGGGTLFLLQPYHVDPTQIVTTLYAFPGPAGVDAGLTAGLDGGSFVLFGTTYSGGANGAGSVFRFDPASGAFATLHNFSGLDGAYPVPGSLMQARDGNLYGTTQLGGNGTVYKLNPTTGEFRTLHQFSGTTDGRAPLGGVVEGGDGYLYGTTVLGGQGYGTVYRVHPTTVGDYSIVVRFGGSNGRSPSGNLTRASDGSLYGVTRLGGAYNVGTLYRIKLDSTPPQITKISTTPKILTPANGKFVAVVVAVTATDNDGYTPTSKIVGVTCNQPADGDWKITGDLTVNLRARSTGRTNRIYTLLIESTDRAGNVSTGTVDVAVKKK